MSDLLSPGDERADGVLDDAALLASLLSVEEGWAHVLRSRGWAPAGAALAPGALAALVGARDAGALARAAETDGNPVPALVALLRTRLEAAGRGEAAAWLHRGLTSQDVLDTALVLGVREAAARVLARLRTQAGLLRALAATHRDSVQAGRTLTQHAVPTTFGLVAAGWLHAVLDVEERLSAAAAALPAQVGGAAGTLAAIAELAAAAGDADAARGALDAAADLADHLDLRAGPPWHVRRTCLGAVADALVACTDTWGALAATVLVRARPEVGELGEGRPGGSSTMPHKANPVLSVLVRRAALTAPGHAATVHLAAATAEDERPAGSWHAEWPALRALARTAVVAAEQSTDLLAGLVVEPARMRAGARAAAADLLAEQRAVRALVSRDLGPDDALVPGPGADQDPGGADAALAGYLGAAGLLVDAALERADQRGGVR